jgi:hypothetical protein
MSPIAESGRAPWLKHHLCIGYFEKLECHQPLYSTVKQSVRKVLLELYLYGAI